MSETCEKLREVRWSIGRIKGGEESFTGNPEDMGDICGEILAILRKYRISSKFPKPPPGGPEAGCRRKAENPWEIQVTFS